MAKSKTKPASDRHGKSRMEVRFDEDVFDGLKQLADDSGVSMNQILHGLARWAVKNGVAGEPFHNEKGLVNVKKIPGCLFFGRRGECWEYGEAERYQHEFDVEPGDYKDNGQVIFALDFTERRVVRED